MKILVLGLNYAPEIIGIGPYTAGLARALTKAGHDVRVVAGQPYYPEWRSRPGTGGWRRERHGRLHLWRVPHFIPGRPTGALRLLHHFSFALAALVPMLWAALVWRPDRVVAIAPSLMAAPLALAAARMSGASAWLHVQDFELDAAAATGLIARGWPLDALLGAIERFVLCRFDHLSSISPAMCRRLAEKGVANNRISEHRNWAETHRITPGDGARYRNLWSVRTPNVALYAGALGRKHGLELIVATARRLAHRADLTFVICGNGPDRAALEATVDRLDNVVFQDLQPREQLGALLGLASMHLLPQIAGAQDLVLPSKLSNMLSSGRPVIATADTHSAIAEEVSGCGLVTAPGDVAAFAGAIERLCDDPQLRERLGHMARVKAEARWNRSSILADFVSAIETAERPALAAPLAGEGR